MGTTWGSIPDGCERLTSAKSSRSFAALNSHGKRTMAGLPFIAKVIP
jgi:hypothetical protein